MDNIRLASLKDIAAMKLNAIQNRGSKKDFVDIYYLLQQFSLNEILLFHQTKYPNRDSIIALKSLIYFNDAEPQPDCELTSPISWGNIKEFLEKEVLKF
jgi:predicted nucleotidyltransferase component of viral defense system